MPREVHLEDDKKLLFQIRIELEDIIETHTAGVEEGNREDESEDESPRMRQEAFTALRPYLIR